MFFIIISDGLECINSTNDFHSFLKMNYQQDIYQLLAPSNNQPVSRINFIISSFNDSGFSEANWILTRSLAYTDIKPETILYTSFFGIKAIHRFQTFKVTFCNLTEEYRDLIISHTLLSIGTLAKDPNTVPKSLYLCWEISGQVLFHYQHECWTSSGEYFNYEGYNRYTLAILCSSLALDIFLTAFGCMLFKGIFDVADKNEVDGSYFINVPFIVCGIASMAVFIISIIYETTVNSTNPRIISYFFVAAWVLIGIYMINTVVYWRGNLLKPILHAAISLCIFELFFWWWINSLMIGIFIETNWSLNIFTGLLSILAVAIAAIIQVIQIRNSIEQYSKEKSLDFRDLQTNFWFLRKPCIIIAIFMLVSVVGLSMFLIWLCLSYIQHTSIEITIIQSSINLIIGVIVVFIERSHLKSGYDPNNGLSSTIIDTIAILQKNGEVKKPENPNFHNFPFPHPIKLVFRENPEGDEVIVINSDWTLDTLRTEAPQYYKSLGLSFEDNHFEFKGKKIYREMEKMIYIKDMDNTITIGPDLSYLPKESKDPIPPKSKGYIKIE